jgi:hypothetical protein
MKRAKSIGKILGIALAILMVGAILGAAALPSGDLDKNQVSGQEDASYITVYATDLKGIEIASIEGEELFVSALVEGVSFTAASTGIHRFTIIGGASEVCPPEAQPNHPEWWGWKTEILIYKNRPIYWSGGYLAPERPNPANWDFLVGSSDFQPTYEAAEQTGKGMFVDIALEENEYVILVVNDCTGCFFDNSGGVYLSITILPPVPQYNLITHSSAGGSVTGPGEGTFTYDEGAVVDLVAEPAEGYCFAHWTGNATTIADVDAASTTVTMNGDYSVTANFERIPEHTLSISSAAGGSVTTPGEGDFTYEEGTVVGLEVEPDEGYQFVNWTGDVSTISNVEAASTTITMNDDYSITANFEAVGGCFIATAAYGTPMAEEIQILREFRDEYLLISRWGQALVDLYYRVSPPIADFVTDHPSLKPIVVAGFMPIVAMCSIVFEIVPQFTGNEA